MYEKCEVEYVTGKQLFINLYQKDNYFLAVASQ